jgi:uncharacterized Zn-binding protein involved in type VI secretion
MKNSNGLGVVRLGDKTSHGGQVISAQSTFTVLGRAVAVQGDQVICPKCKGVFPIQVTSSERRHHGKPVAYDGDKAACGAKLMSSI